ncbi:MAG: histidinol dehydrogenase [Clostridia bacterium]|nr:histidinol dehydrogenase [Clostridia bacterium]
MISVYDLTRGDTPEIFDRTAEAAMVTERVAEILARVRAEGDAAVLEYERRFDRAEMTAPELSPEAWEEGAAAVEPEFVEILREAAENIRAFHENQLRRGFETRREDGVVLGQCVRPLARVGIYVPGGTAAYPSTVLMNAIPAKLAGVEEVIMTTPPGPDGKITPAILAAAKIAGVDRIFRMGGAQAVGALSYGTETVPRVDKIVGPGNCYVAEAKRQVYGLVDIDMIAGPSEILVIADGASNPAFVAADLLSQAEHDRMASAVLVTESADLAAAVSAELERQIPLLSRAEIARESIDRRGRILITSDIAAAVELANELAPEHLEICTEDPFRWLPAVKNAGSVFLGRWCPEALGDYFAGPNHTLPTSGTARFASPLSVDDFIKKYSYTYYTKDALAEVYEKIGRFADREGLGAHAKSVRIRFEEEK